MGDVEFHLEPLWFVRNYGKREMWDFASYVDPRHNTPMSTQKEQFPIEAAGFLTGIVALTDELVWA